MRGFVLALASLVLGYSGGAAEAAIVTGGLIQDLNAQVGVATSGSNVTGWANQAVSGGDNLAFGSGTVTLVPNAINGMNAVSLSATGKLIGSSVSAFDGLVGGSGYTWIAVVDSNEQVGVSGIFGTLLNGAPFHGMIARVDAGTNAPNITNVFGAGPVVNQISGTTNVANGGFHILMGRLAAGTGTPLAEVFVDSPIAEASGNPAIAALTDAGALTVGAERVGGGEYWEGQIARILIYNRPLTLDELNQTGYALASQYALSTQFVPEPSGLALAGLGVVGLMRLARRRK